MRTLLKWSLRSIVLLAALFLIAVVAVVVVLNTESGSRWAVARTADAVPGELATEGVQGTFWRGLHFDSIRYLDDSQDILIADVDLELRWSSMTIGRIGVEHVRARSFTRTSLLPQPVSPEPLEIAMAPLPVRIAVENVLLGEMILQSASSQQVITGIEIQQLRIVGNRLAGRAASANIEPVDLKLANFSITLAGDVPTSAMVDWRLVDGRWAGSGPVRGSLAKLVLEQSVDGDYPGVVSGSVSVLERVDPFFDLLLHWDKWSIESVDVMDGQLELIGELENYVTNFDTTIAISALSDESYSLSGTANGSLDGLSGLEAQLLATRGNVDLLGDLQWNPEFASSLGVIATDIDPAVFHEALSGTLNGTASLVVDDQGTVVVDALTLAGVLNEVPMSATGGLLISATRNECRECTLIVGSNRISANGHLAADDIELSFDLQAPTLAELLPELSGAMTGRGRIEGPLDDPDINGTATLQNISYQDTQYGHLTVTGRGGLHAADIAAEWQLDDLSANANAVLRFEDEGFSGEIRKANVAKDRLGSWTLAKPMQFEALANTFAIEENEWNGELGDLRITRITKTEDTVSVIASLRNVPLQMANTALPTNYQLFGIGTAAVNLNRQNEQWTGTLDWEQSDTVLRVTDISKEITEVVVPRMTLAAELRDGGMQATAAIEIEPGVTGDLELGLTALAVDAPMTASLQLEGDDWGWISSVVPQIDRFEGSIRAAVSAAGPLNEPQFSGTLEWSEGRLVVPSINVPLEQIEVVVTGASAGTATITGKARAGEGNLELWGFLGDIMQDTRSATFTLKGEGAELINWPEYHIWGSPDIVLTGNADLWRMAGRFEVPKADISLREVPVGAVSLSPDVVVQGEDEELQSRTKFAAETRLVLGERVHFDALGLDTRLVGDVFLKLAGDRPPVAQGKVSLVDGTFVAQGQRLRIEQGELIFTGPLDDPIVDVRAVRVIETFDEAVTVGIHLRGRAQNLTTTVYSDPPMADADALSYLVVGRPLSQATETEGGKLSGAAIALGLQQATRVTDQIGQAIGLDQLALAGDGGETTALVAGKQINSRLHARYAYSVFSRLGTLLLRYRLSRRLTLEAGAGENQSIDVLYSVEK